MTHAAAQPAYDLKKRTRLFALQIINLSSSLPRRMEALVLGKQIVRSGTSVGAQYREATRSRSNAEFASKMNGALQELEETMYWLELLADSPFGNKPEIQKMLEETDELCAIFTSSINTAKKRGE